MSVVPERQAALLVMSLLLGAGLGLIYDVLTPIRRWAGKYGAIIELIYAAAASVLVFVFAMHESLGRLTLWDALSICLGFIAYEYYLAGITVKIVGAAKKFLKKLSVFLKKSSKFPDSFFHISKI